MHSIRQSFFLFFIYLTASLLPDVLHAQTYVDPKNNREARLGFEKVDYPILIELFTSTDCLNCIFADSQLYKLSKENRVIALSCHIDGFIGKEGYSDHIANICSNRLHYYFESFGIRGDEIYTPQMTINGGIPFFAGNERDMETYLRSYMRMYTPLTIDIAYTEEDQSGIQFTIPDGLASHTNYSKSFNVFVIRYQDSAVIKVQNEKLGSKERVIRYTNMLQDIQHVGLWYGEKKTFTIDLSSFPQAIRSERGGWIVTVSELNGRNYAAIGHIKDIKEEDLEAEEKTEEAVTTPSE